MKMFRSILAILMMLTLLPLCAAAEERFADTDALQNYLLSCRMEGLAEFEANCTAELYDELQADSHSLLYKICYLAGMKNFRFRANRNGDMSFSSVTYSGDYVAQCETEEDVWTAVKGYLAQGAQEITLLCTEGVFQSMYRNSRMYRLMAEQGIEDFTMEGNTKNVIFLSEMKPYTVPCAQVSSISEAGERISAWAETGVPEFNLIYDEAAFADLTREDYALIAFLGGVDDYRLSYSSRMSMLYFTDVTYTDVPGIYCTSEDAVVEAIRAMGAKGFTNFQLKLDADTFQTVYADQFTRLYELQAQAGMSDADLRYSVVSNLLLFENAVISSDARILGSLDEVIAYVDDCIAREEQDINMLLASEVYNDLMDGVSAFFASDAKFYDMTANAGIMHMEDTNFNRKSGAINLRGVQLFPGLKISTAVEKGDTSALTSREWQTLEAAQALAQECLRADQTATALAIHDALCALITYTDDETTDEDDCCIGALLDGRANCDGYADAMLLVGRLAGLNVRYQHGDSVKGGLGSLFASHLWNLVEIDGTWRMIDVTWDDGAEGRYTMWFNIGEDRAALSHTWSRDMTVPMLAVTNPYNRPVAEFYAATEDEITAAAMEAQAAGNTVFDIYMTVPDFNRFSASRAALNGLSGSVQYVWIDALMCLHVELTP